jgi:hypothetical protein
LRWLADENFNNDTVRALRRSIPDIDIVRAQDAGLTAVDDETLLAWAAEHDRILPTHDVSTITAHAYRRVMKGDRCQASSKSAAGLRSVRPSTTLRF